MKGPRGAVAALLSARKHGAAPIPTGEYLLWIENTLTPTIGGAVASNTFTLSGGYLTTADAVMTLAAPKTINYFTDSIVYALRWVNPADAAAPMVLFADTTLSAGPGMQFTATSNNSTGWAVYDRLSNAAEPSADATPATPLGATEYSGILLYDAATRAAYRAVNGVIPGGSGNVPIPLENFALEHNKLIMIGGAGGLKIRDIQIIKFAGLGLPTNWQELVAAYHANPLTKLSAWAT